MKKKKIIILIAVLFIILGIIGYILWNNRITSTIYLDINPSIEINLTRNNKVKNILALNDDAKDIINDDLKGKSINDTLKVITNNVIEKGYVEDGNVVILLYTKGNIDKQELQNQIKTNFDKKELYADIIIVDNVTKEDEELANKYNISPAKASYINSVSKDNSNLSIDTLLEKSVKEIKETKEKMEIFV